MSRFIAWLLVIVVITSACVTTPGSRAGRTSYAPAEGAAVDHAGCEDQAKAAADSKILRLVLSSGFAGMFLVAVYGAADGAHAAALAGGSAGDGAWIGAVVGAGVGAIIGLVIGLKRAQGTKATYAARLVECLGEGRAPMTREDQTAAPAVTSLSLGG
jgi:hypothetical protein